MKADVKNQRKYVVAVDRSHNPVGITDTGLLEESQSLTSFRSGEIAARRHHGHFRLCLAGRDSVVEGLLAQVATTLDWGRMAALLDAPSCHSVQPCARADLGITGASLQPERRR